MEEIKQQILNHQSIDKWEFMINKWQSLYPNKDALVIINGIDDDSAKTKTQAFQTWLFKIEYIDSIMIISQKKIYILCSSEKVKFLEFLQAEFQKQNKKIEFFQKEKGKAQNAVQELITKLQNDQIKNLGLINKEEQHGETAEVFYNAIKKDSQFLLSDISSGIEQSYTKKLQCDLEILKASSQAVKFFMDQFIKEIEQVVDENLNISHSKLSLKMDEFLEKQKSSLKRRFNIIDKFFDYSYTPVIQSSGDYDLKPNSESNDKELGFNVILLNLAGRYFDFNSNIYRTLFINPTELEQKYYLILLSLFNEFLKNLKVGQKISDCVNKSLEGIKQKHPELVGHLPQNFGYGMGYEYKEKELLLSLKNQTIIEENMVFNLILSFQGLQTGWDFSVSMHIADMLQLQRSSPLNLTEQVSKEFKDVGYNVEEENNTASKAKLEDKKPERLKVSSEHCMTRSEIRKLKLQQEQETQFKQKQNQQRLMAEKMQELKERVESGDLIQNTEELEKTDLGKLEGYDTEKLKNLNFKIINISEETNTVIFPIHGALLPIHASCIRNLTKTSDKQYVVLRVNLHTPFTISQQVIFPQLEQLNNNPIYIKELTFRSSNYDLTMKIIKDVKDLIKNYKLKQSMIAKEISTKQEENLQNKIRDLPNVKIRPTLEGRKSEGILSAYKNGFWFVSKSQKQINIFNSNIKLALFQPCEDNMIVLIHFYLKKPLIIQKSLTDHVQFYTEIGTANQDLIDPRNKGKQYQDEYEEEEREDEQRQALNQIYLKFVKDVEAKWNIPLKFDCPFQDKGFFGSPNSNNVFICPSAYCLSSVVERPFFLVLLEEIELVSIERVDNQIKNFDMIIIFKNYNKSVKHIDNIPKTSLPQIKEWLNSENILFIEGGNINIKWDKYLKTIVDDPETFIKEGGWAGFMESDDSEENEKSNDNDSGDSAFEEKSEESDEDDEDFSSSELVDEEEDFDEESGKEDEEQFEDDDYSDDEEEKIKKKKINKK